MPTEKLFSAQELHGCLRNLVALSTSPANWIDHEPREIADSAAAALVSTLHADLIYVALPGVDNEPLIEVRCAGDGVPASLLEAIQALQIRSLIGRADQSAVTIIPIGEAKLRIVTAPMGIPGDALLAAGSSRPHFPSKTERLRLEIAANHLTVMLQRGYAETGKRRFVSLVQRSSDFIGLVDLEGRPQYVNPAGLKLAGLENGESFSALQIFDFLVAADRVRAHDEFWPAVMKAGRWVGELNLRHFRTGAAIPTMVDWFRIDHPRTGRPMNIATVIRDLTASKKQEAELRHLNETLELLVGERTIELNRAYKKLQSEIVEREHADARFEEAQLELFHAARRIAIGQLTSTLAHELNQPLSAAVNSVNAARRLLGKGGRGNADIIREIMDETAGQIMRAGQIIRRLRDFVSRGDIEMQIGSLPAMIEEASALTLTDLGSRGVHMHFHFDPEASQVLANRIQVQQVLVNLVRNAIEAMSETGGGELTVSTKKADDENVEITVADRGPGLSKASAARLFEPFFSTKHDGMGLGLSICRTIIEAHGGKLRNEPNPGGGTIFRFSLPAGHLDGDK